jgi:hypothetical protein
MAAPRKKPKPGDNDGGMRIEKASDRPKARAAGKEIEWINPREPLPSSVIGADVTDAADTPTRRTIMDAAIAVFPDPKLIDQNLLAAVLIAQALDRLGDKLGNGLTEAAAVSRYRGT